RIASVVWHQRKPTCRSGVEVEIAGSEISWVTPIVEDHRSEALDILGRLDQVTCHRVYCGDTGQQPFVFEIHGLRGQICATASDVECLIERQTTDSNGIFGQ